MRVLDGVVSEEEAFRHVDGRPQPLGEVGIVDGSYSLGVLVFHKLYEVVVIQL